MAVGFRCDFPGLRQGDLLLERIAGSAAAGTHARHRLRLSDESAHVALDLGDRVERIDAGHYRGMRRVRARDRLELRELGLLPAAHFLEGDFDPHLRHRGVRQIVEGQALHDGPDRAREGVRLPPDLRAQGTWPPQNPMDFWMRPRGYQDLPLVAESHGPDGSDAPAELLLRRLGHHLGRPGWLPDDVHDRLLDALELFELSLYVLVDVCRSGASGGGEGHLDINLALVRLEVDVVHKTEVVDVDRDLGVVALPQDADHFFLRGHGSAFDRTYVGRGILTLRFGVLDEVLHFSQPGELRIKEEEDLFQLREERVRLVFREESQGRICVQANVRRTSHVSTLLHPLAPGDLTFILGETVGRAHGMSRRDHIPQFDPGLIDAAGLQATIRVDEELRGREDREGLLDPLPDQGFRFDHVAMDVHDAERDLLLERLPLETVQQVEARIRHLQIELVHGEFVEVVENLVRSYGNRYYKKPIIVDE